MASKVGKLKLITVAEMAALTGKTARTIRLWIDEGMPVYERGQGAGTKHQINAPEAFGWLVDREKSEGANASARYEKGRADKMESEAKLVAIELERAQGTVVDVPVAISIFSDRLAAIRGSLQSMPARSSIAVAAAKTREEVRSILEDEVNEVLRSMGATFSDDDAVDGQT